MAWIFPLDLNSSTTDGGSGKLGRGTLTPQSTEDKTEDVSMSATYNEPNADTQLWFSTYSKSLNFQLSYHLWKMLVGKSSIYIPSTYILGTIAGTEWVIPYQQLPSRYQNSNLHNTSHAIRHVTDETSKHLSNIWQISQAFSNNSFCRARRWDFGIQYTSVIYILGFFQRFSLGPSA